MINSETPSLPVRWRYLFALRWRTGLAAFLCVAAAGVVAIFLPRPVYRAEARLRIGEPPPASGVSPTASILGLFRPGGDPFANDLEVLGSRTVTERLVRDEALAVALRAPRGWYRDSLFARLTADTTTRKATYEARWVTPDSVLVRMTEPADSSIGGVHAGAPIRFGGITAIFRPGRSGAPERVQLRTIAFAEAVRRATHRVEVTRTRREANVVELGSDGPDPALVQRVVVDAIASFVALRANLQEHESGQTVDSLRRVVDSTRADLARADDALAAWERRTGLVAPDAQAEAFFKRYGDVAAEVTAAQSERNAVTHALATSDSTATAWADVIGAPTLMKNPTVAALVGSLTGLEQQRRAVALKRQPDDRVYKELTGQIGYADSALHALVQGYQAALDRQIETLDGEKAALDSAVRVLPAASIERARRERTVRVLAEVVSLAEERLRQEQLRTALTFANVQVIDPPALLARPVWPRTKLGLAVTLVLATGLAGLAMVVRDRADVTIRHTSQIERVLGAPLLGTVVRTGGAESHLVEGVAAFAHNGHARADRFAIVDGGGPAVAADAAAILRASGISVGAVGRVDRFPAAAGIAHDGGAVVVVGQYGFTTIADLARAARLLRAAGCEVAGGVVSCGSDAESRRLWGL